MSQGAQARVKLTHRPNMASHEHSTGWGVSARNIFHKADEKLALASDALVSKLGSLKTAKRLSSMRGIRWTIAVTLVLCVFLALCQLGARLVGDEEDEDGDASGASYPSSRGPRKNSRGSPGRTQSEADSGVAREGSKLGTDLLDENSADPLLYAGEDGRIPELGRGRGVAVRSRGWAVKQGAPLQPLPPWRWQRIDPSCKVDSVVAPSTADAEVLPETWEAFQASGRSVVFPTLGRRAVGKTGSGGVFRLIITSFRFVQRRRAPAMCCRRCPS